MYAIEFQAQIHNGVIEIPEEQRADLLAKVNGGVVRVIVMAPEKKEIAATQQMPVEPEIDLVQDAKDKGYSSFIDYLLDHPIRIPDVEYLTREEAHER